MESRPSADKDKRLSFHGVWVAGFKISDRLIKSIATEFSQKPSRPANFSLTSKGLNLQVLPVASLESASDKDSTTEIKSGKPQQVSFSALRDVSINPHNQHCLMVVFVDAKNRFSIMVFSCENARTLWEITTEFKELRNRNVLRSLSPHPPGGANGADPTAETSSGNWTLRQQVQTMNIEEKSSHSHPAVLNGVSENSRTPQGNQGPIHVSSIILEPQQQPQDPQQNGNSAEEQEVQIHSNRSSVIFSEVYEEYTIERELVSDGAEDGPSMFNVCLQVDVVDSPSDTDSVFFPGSFKSSSSNSQAETDNGVLETISAEEYHSRRNRPTSRDTEPTDPTDDHSMSTPVVNGHGIIQNGGTHVAQESSDSALTLRSVGTQTDAATPNPQRGRYTKKRVNVSLSNQYKEKVAAVRKKSGNAAPTAAATTTTTTASAINGSSASSSHFEQGELIQTRPTKSVVTYRSKSLQESATVHHRPVSMNLSSPPRLITSGTTVSRPIESVYSPKIRYSEQSKHDLQQHPQEAEQHGRVQGLHPFASQRVVVLPNKQAVLVSPRTYWQSVPGQRPYLSATPSGRFRKASGSSTNSAGIVFGAGDSRNSSRTSSLRARAKSGQQPSGRVVTYHQPQRQQVTHLL
ncbi:hypothetical protein PoB_002895800 [Plakobranchus ocellatus]|uniref:Uncharacterized protein n=1 Tax=Plakobranchus ocellatus TaxID=259542 RepID=A0AAV4A5I3_9GAST|nr:hypothetical protein PoB_002895800 [Plakobranchus ocellatus]